MTEQGTRTLTEAEKALTELVLGGVEFTIADKAIHNWVAEIASDVRALAATVAEQGKAIRHREVVSDSTLRELYVLKQRLSALERGQGTLSQSAQSLDRDHVGLSDRLAALEYQRDRAEADADDLEQIRSRVLPQSPGSAEAAPEPVCELGERCDGSCQRCEDLMFERIYGGEPEQAVQEPPALDPVLVKSINELCDLVDWLAHGTVHMIGAGMCGEIFTRTSAIRAYGGDAREGGK